jgi:putative oxidoreductase
MRTYTKNQNIALFVTRIIVAVIFIYAAYAKLPLWQGVPEGMSAGMVGLMKFLTIVEPLGALALIIGYLTRWASAGLAVIMLGAIYVMQFSLGVGFVTQAGAGWNFPLVVLASCVVLMAFGAGHWSIEARSINKRIVQ